MYEEEQLTIVSRIEEYKRLYLSMPDWGRHTTSGALETRIFERLTIDRLIDRIKQEPNESPRKVIYLMYDEYDECLCNLPEAAIHYCWYIKNCLYAITKIIHHILEEEPYA